MRSVGGNIKKIAFLSPNDVMIELIDLRIGAFKETCALHIGMNDDGGEILEVHFTRELGEADITEAVEGEFWLPGALFTITDVNDLCLGRAVIFVIKIAVVVEDLCMVDHDLFALGTVIVKET